MKSPFTKLRSRSIITPTPSSIIMTKPVLAKSSREHMLEHQKSEQMAGISATLEHSAPYFEATDMYIL